MGKSMKENLEKIKLLARDLRDGKEFPRSPRETLAGYVLPSINGKVAIVTGASNGIGRAIAERLTQDGAMVIVNYGKSADKAKAVVALIESKGGKAVAIQTDMSKVSDVRRLVRETVQRFGRLDILVNNAGMFMSKPLVDTAEEEYDRLFALNAKGVYFAMQEGAKMIEEGGRIVNISTDGTPYGLLRRDDLSGEQRHPGTVYEGAGA